MWAWQQAPLSNQLPFLMLPFASYLYQSLPSYYKLLFELEEKALPYDHTFLHARYRTPMTSA